MGKMIRLSTVFRDPHKSAYHKTDYFHGIWPGEVVASEIKRRSL